MPHREYSEYPTAGAPAQPQPTGEAVNDIRVLPHTAGVMTHSTHWEYAECPTVSTPSTPLQVFQCNRNRRRRSRRRITRAHRRTLQVHSKNPLGVLKEPLGSTQSTPWENVEHPIVSTKSTPLQVRRRRRSRR